MHFQFSFPWEKLLTLLTLEGGMCSSFVHFQLFSGTADHGTFTTWFGILIFTMGHEIVLLREDFIAFSTFIRSDSCAPLGLMNCCNMLNVATPACQAQTTITAIVH